MSASDLIPWSATNPGAGRPKKTNRLRDLQRMCQEYSPRAAMRLIEIVEDKTEDARARIVAAQTILDRAWGKPKEMSEAPTERPAVDFSQLSDLDLATMEGILTKALGGSPDAVLDDDAPEDDEEGVIIEPSPTDDGTRHE